MRSELTSRAREIDRHVSRKRTLKRGCGFEPFNESHIRYCWAAYKKGAFGPQVQEGLSPEEFKGDLLTRTAQNINAGGDLFTLLAHTTKGILPVGIISIAISEAPFTIRQISPHVVWMPWASGRNKLETILKFLVAAKEEGKPIITAREPDWNFFNRLCNYGVIRPVGKLRGHYSDGGDARLYEGVGCRQHSQVSATS